MIDIFHDQYRPYTSDAGLEATDPITLRAFFSPLTPLFTCQRDDRVYWCVCVYVGWVSEREGRTGASVCLPASDEQRVLYLGHQLKVEAML